MFDLSVFYNFCDTNNVGVYSMRAPAPGVTMRHNQDYAIFLDFSQIQSYQDLQSVCAHELSHVATGSLHKVDSPFETQERSEYRANRYTAEHFLTSDDFRAAFSSGIREPWELAEYFNFPEEDIKKALSYWTEQRGIDFNL